jgi:hypothetical protein
MKAQAITAVCLAVGATIFKVSLASRIGLSGVPLGTALAYLLFVWVPIFVFIPKTLSKMQLSHLRCASEFVVVE